MFTTEPVWAGASTSTQKSLQQMNLAAEHIQKIRRAAELLGLTPAIPMWREDASAHVGFPDQKVAIFVVQGPENGTVAAQRTAWAKYGFKLLGADRKKILRATVEEVAAVLQSFLETSPK